jgi:hypothetical protein
MNKVLYTCPMHPEIEQSNPGRCPKCGMKLIVKGEKAESMSHHEVPEKVTWKSYLPLIVVIGLILLTSLTISLRDYQTGTFNITDVISYFMIGFFLTFAGFKLMDLKGFAEGYSTYDLLAKRFFAYGYIYPFIELFFGLAMILLSHNQILLWAEIIVMTFSGIGVTMKLLKKEKFQCACLGTFLKVPLTKITIIEDFGMASLALLLLILS